MRGKHHGIGAARTVQAYRVHVLVERVDRGERQPRFVEMQRVYRVPELFLDHLDVVDDAVVGALGQRQDARVLVLDFARERIGLDFLADTFGLEFRQRDRANNAQVVTRRAQEHRDRAGHRDGVQN